ncbi:unknown [Bacteroides sp. CAG:462]|nr:unknown [Bacteroides sp. CAG:462]
MKDVRFFLHCRKEATRTPDPYVPNVVRYQLRYFPFCGCKGTHFFVTAKGMDRKLRKICKFKNYSYLCSAIKQWCHSSVGRAKD